MKLNLFQSKQLDTRQPVTGAADRGVASRRARGFALLELLVGVTAAGVLTLVAAMSGVVAIGGASATSQVDQVKAVMDNAHASRLLSGMAAPYTCADFEGAIRDNSGGIPDPLAQCSTSDQTGTAAALTRGSWGVVASVNGQTLVHVTADGRVIVWRTDEEHSAADPSVLWDQPDSACTGPVTAALAAASEGAQPC